MVYVGYFVRYNIFKELLDNPFKYNSYYYLPTLENLFNFAIVVIDEPDEKYKHHQFYEMHKEESGRQYKEIYGLMLKGLKKEEKQFIIPVGSNFFNGNTVKSKYEYLTQLAKFIITESKKTDVSSMIDTLDKLIFSTFSADLDEKIKKLGLARVNIDNCITLNFLGYYPDDDILSLKLKVLGNTYSTNDIYEIGNQTRNFVNYLEKKGIHEKDLKVLNRDGIDQSQYVYINNIPHPYPYPHQRLRTISQSPEGVTEQLADDEGSLSAQQEEEGYYTAQQQKQQQEEGYYTQQQSGGNGRGRGRGRGSGSRSRSGSRRKSKPTQRSRSKSKSRSRSPPKTRSKSKPFSKK